MKKKTVVDFKAGTHIRVRAKDGREVHLRVSWINADGTVYVRERMKLVNFLGGEHERWIGPFQVDATLEAEEVWDEAT